jgi:hypothetical protein
MRYDEARALLVAELDRAFMDGVERVTVLHGIGDGILRKMVIDVAGSLDYAEVVPVDPHAIGKNPGVTVLHLLIPGRALLKKYRPD